MSRVVLGTSAAVEIALDTDTGLRLAGRRSPDDEVVVPDHFYAETGAALRRMEARARSLSSVATLRQNGHRYPGGAWWYTAGCWPVIDLRASHSRPA